MNNIIIMYDYVSDRIERDLDELRNSLPEGERHLFDAERGEHRQAIINHIGKYGTYPEIGGVTKND